MADSSHSCSAHGAGTRSIVLGERLSIHTSPQCSSDYTDGKCELKQSLIPKPRSLLLSIMEKLRRKIRMFAFHTRLFILILQFVCNWVIPDHQAGLQTIISDSEGECQPLWNRLELFYQADAFQWPIDPTWVPTIADTLVGFLLDGLIR